MSHTTAPRFGIATAPQQVTYRDVLRVWREADSIPQIEHAWVFDHLLPIAGDLDGPIFEGWTLLSALAAQTERLRLGVLVTSNRFRPPAMLAKIAATVDVVSGGRLDFGIGAGSRPSLPMARREYEANGLPYHDFAHSVGDLAEACTVIQRLWTSEQPFDFDGSYVRLTGAFCNPKPVQRPYPPILIGDVRPRRCAWSPSMPTCGTSPVVTSTTPSAAAPCWTASARRSAAIPPRSPGPSSFRLPTTTLVTHGRRSRKPSTQASRTSS
jgi:alkanesulfonate monooxygenase SsuD/methylene tetrahydromethanopterin reductase-like flavin-dependent oxidoreductase (luciferase family)